MVSRFERWSFASGDAGFNFFWRTIETYLLFYYIKILGLSPEYAASVFLIGAAVDFFADPLIGMMVDRSGNRWPMRTWLPITGPLLGLSLAIVFLAPHFADQWIACFVLLTHIILRFCYSMGNIPYSALTARISDDPDEHVRLTAARMEGAALGGIVAAITYMVFPVSAESSAVPWGVILLSLAAQPLFLITYFGVKERRRPASIESKGLFAQLRAYKHLLVRSAEVRQLCILILFAGISATTLNKSILFLFDQIGHLRRGYEVALLPPLMLLITVPGWSIFARKHGRKLTLRVAILLHFGAIILLALTPPNALHTSVLVGLSLAGESGVAVSFWSLIPAVIEAAEERHGFAGIDARIYALASTARKLGQALAPQLIVLAMSSGGGVIRAMVWAASAAAFVCVFTAIKVTRRDGRALFTDVPD